LLVAALAVAACGGGTGAGTSAADAVPAAQTSQTLDPEAAVAPSPQTTDAASATFTFDPGTAIDAVDSDLTALDRFLNGLDTLLSGSDGGAYGGE
jgi:ABC-type transport system substrate-binding protein